MYKLLENLLFKIQKMKQHNEEIIIKETGKKDNSYIFFIAGKVEAYDFFINELEQIITLNGETKEKEIYDK